MWTLHERLVPSTSVMLKYNDDASEYGIGERVKPLWLVVLQ